MTDKFDDMYLLSPAKFAEALAEFQDIDKELSQKDPPNKLAKEFKLKRLHQLSSDYLFDQFEDLLNNKILLKSINASFEDNGLRISTNGMTHILDIIVRRAAMERLDQLYAKNKISWVVNENGEIFIKSLTTK